MLDIGWQELLLIGVVALVVIGPKDMPVAMRAAARTFSKVRGLSREFQSTVSEVVREAELDELRRKVQEAGRVNVKDGLTNLVDPTGRLREDLSAGNEFELEDDLRHQPPRQPSPSVAAGPAATGSPTGAIPTGAIPPGIPSTAPPAAPTAAASTTPTAEVERRE